MAPDIAKDLLKGFDLSEFDRQNATICVVDRTLRLAYVNAGWLRFAKENACAQQVQERWPLGSNLLSSIHGKLKEYYADGFLRCLNEQTLWRHDYECSSPGNYRLMHMEVLPLREGRGLLMIHSSRLERAHTHKPFAPQAARYLDGDGVIHQCSHCRRIRLADDEQTWEWVPHWVEEPPSDISHDLCQICLRYYYPCPKD